MDRPILFCDSWVQAVVISMADTTTTLMNAFTIVPLTFLKVFWLTSTNRFLIRYFAISVFQQRC